MPLALILSSYVAAARIGGAAQQYVLAAHGIDPVLVPTVLLGRSPAKGAQGQPTDPALFARLLADVEADGVFAACDLVITGHFSSPDQVEIAARAVAAIKAAHPRAVVLVDPIMGDHPKGLYVKPQVADALSTLLVPLADYLAPNLWELDRLAPGDVAGAAARLGRPVLVTSVDAQSGAIGPGDIGLAYVDDAGATLFAHRRLDNVPNGTGDLVTASFGACLVNGLNPLAAAKHAARAAAEVVEAAHAERLAELPLVALGQQLAHPTADLRIETLARS